MNKLVCSLSAVRSSAIHYPWLTAPDAGAVCKTRAAAGAICTQSPAGEQGFNQLKIIRLVPPLQAEALYNAPPLHGISTSIDVGLAAYQTLSYSWVPYDPERVGHNDTACKEHDSIHVTAVGGDMWTDTGPQRHAAGLACCAGSLLRHPAASCAL